MSSMSRLSSMSGVSFCDIKSFALNYDRYDIPYMYWVYDIKSEQLHISPSPINEPDGLIIRVMSIPLDQYNSMSIVRFTRIGNR
jgi:hypothetical protein